MTNSQHYVFIWRSIFSIVLSVFMFLPMSVSQAASGRDDSLEKLLARAELVVHGQFINVSSSWQGKKIVTQGSFQITHLVKGQRQGVINVEYMGGTAMHPLLQVPVTMKASDSVSFSQGEEAVLVLRLAHDDRYQIIGMSRGKIPVQSDANGDKYVVGFSRIQGVTSAANGQQTTISGEAMTLDEFIAFARSLLARKGNNQ